MWWRHIDELLRNKKISLKELAIKSNVNYETIRSYKYRGYEPSFKNMCKIADALGVSLDKLRGDKKCNH
ncbi:helix-turn-helix transcriptional regulator [Lactobacillus paragasseri]|uniref:helix-turn-helix domain-containing protein n=1 Tax=Lactobacillus paragasseri TaxID=2107999 RepID=UPI00254F3BF8|nr:helix-turn-helix transcriptional regulator [Lactobacillus paragasseri]MDK7067308.1 helix-turn-helix transcriptional regulator [Lactobacillus paragasseri]